MADTLVSPVNVLSPYAPPSRSQTLDNTNTREGRLKSGSNVDSKPQSNGKILPGKIIRTISASYGSNPHAGGFEARGMDPLSQRIYERTHPENVISPKSRSGTIAESETDAFEGLTLVDGSQRTSGEGPTRIDSIASISKDKKNRGSFFGRFMGSKKKESQVEIHDEEHEIGDARVEGTNAEMFSQPIGYIPKFAEPPKYIKVRARGKKEKSFDRVFLAQELRGRTGVEVAQAGGRRINPSEKMKRGEAIWAMEFSKDGRFLAAGGSDHIVRVWGVIATEEDRQVHETQEEAVRDGPQTRLNAPVFKRKPVQEYDGHTETILALSWSKNNFLLSSSMDKTVRLYHTSRSECLCVFKHGDVVSSIQFHPRDDRFFLAGSLDSKLRLWSIPDKGVAFFAQLPELITAVGFTPDGKTAIAGCFGGQCVFYETDGLRQLTQMHVRSAHGKNAKGSKITGIQTSEINGQIKLLITSNDSRVRLYNFRDKSLELKLKDAENSTSQIRASFSDDAKHIISGSEDKKVYIWTTGGPVEKEKDKRPVEMFEAHSVMVTTALMAPTRTRQLLQASGDPLYDICNPPPVQLVSRTESQASNHTPDQDPWGDVMPQGSTSKSRPEETPAYIARSTHPGGNVIVTADFQGHIKVFRQDCAYKQRIRNNDNWDTSSTFSKKVLHRSSSIATRHSRHSTHDSLGPHQSSDRILSWRQSIDRSSIHSASLHGSHDMFPLTPRSGAIRSPSPRKTPFASVPNTPLSGTHPGHRQLSASHPLSSSTTHIPSVSTTASSATGSERLPERGAKSRPKFPLSPPPSAISRESETTPTLPPATTMTERPHNHLRHLSETTASSIGEQAFHEALQNPSDAASISQSESFVNASDISETSPQRRGQPPSSGKNQNEMEEEAETEEEETTDSEGERCVRCGGDNFRAKKVSKAWGGIYGGKERVLECVNCGTVVR